MRGEGRAISVSPVRDRDRPAEVVAGLMASASIAASLIALAYRPIRIAPFAILIALIAAGIGGRHGRLAALAVWVGTACFIGGMVIAVITRNPLF